MSTLIGKKLLLIDNINLINGQGGVEHVLCNMANVTDDMGMNVVVATMENRVGMPFYKLNPSVKFVNTYKKFTFISKVIRKIFRQKNPYLWDLKHKSKLWNKFIKSEKPDFIVCFSLPTLLEVTYRQAMKVPVILTIHGSPINDYTNRFWARPDFENELMKNAYVKADVIQVLLDSYKSTIPDTFSGKTYTIPNIAPYNDYTIDYKNKVQNKIVCIASLDERKHQDLLIQAFSSIAEDYPNWVLELWGTGNKREEYQSLINKNNLTDRIFLRGSTENSKEVLKTTDIFALPSTCEGWPLVLGEAMSMGIPCIGLGSCDGVNEIIRDCENGLLSNDSCNVFAEKLRLLMSDADLRKKFGVQAQKDMKNYSPDIVWEKWKQLLIDTLEEKSLTRNSGNNNAKTQKGIRNV